MSFKNLSLENTNCQKIMFLKVAYYFQIQNKDTISINNDQPLNTLLFIWFIFLFQYTVHGNIIYRLVMKSTIISFLGTALA